MGHDAVRYLEKMKRLYRTPNDRRNDDDRRRSDKRSPLHGPDDVAYRLAISACARA